MTYGYHLWFYKNSPCKNHIKLLSKTQHQAALWITGAFCTFPTGGVETIAGLLPVCLQLHKLKNKSFLHNKRLHSSHPTLSLFSLLWGKGRGKFSIDKLTLGQQRMFKSPINKITINAIVLKIPSHHMTLRPGLGIVYAICTQIIFITIFPF